MYTWETKHPATVLDYSVDCTDYLQDVGGGDTLQTVLFTIDNLSGLTILRTTNTPRIATVTLSGGNPDTTAYITFKMTTTTGLISTEVIQMLIRA